MTSHIAGLDEQYEDAIQFLKQVDADDTVLIVHHWDMDGSAATAITSNILQELRDAPADLVRVPDGRVHTVSEREEQLLVDEDVDVLIVLDMHVPADRIAELAGHGVEILLIDHHNFDAIPDKAVFVNPRVFDEEAYIPASKLCNDLAGRLDMDQDWIAGFGIIQDFAVEGNEAVFERLREEYPMYFPDELTQHTLAKDCRYGKYSSVMNIKPYRDTDKCARLAHDALVDAKGLKYLEAREEYQALQTYYREMYREIERAVEHFDEEKETYDEAGLVFFAFDSDYHINSSIATRISMDNEDRVYLIANTHDGTANISARCQSGRVDLGTVLQQALPDDADGEAGGHRRAAGATLPADQLHEFKENVLSRI